MRGQSLLARIALAGALFAGTCNSAMSQASLPSNGGSIVLPSILPFPVDLSSPRLTVTGADKIGEWVGVRDGRLDLFSVRPADAPGFKPTLRGGFGGDGLQLQLNW